MLVDLSENIATAMRSSFWYGVPRAGKTDFCATFPRPAWFGSQREGGFETLRYMDPQRLYEPGRKPLAFTVTSAAEIMTHLNKDVMPRVARGEIKTIIFELSFYTDDLIRGNSADGWAKYGDLEKHIVFLDDQWKKIPGLRIVYNSLATTEEDSKKPAGALMAGRALPRKMPALCDVIGYMRPEDAGNGKLDRVTHLQPFGNYPAGHRYGNRLPPLMRNATFRHYEALLQGRGTVDAMGNVTVTADAPALPGLTPLPTLAPISSGLPPLPVLK